MRPATPKDIPAFLAAHRDDPVPPTICFRPQRRVILLLYVYLVINLGHQEFEPRNAHGSYHWFGIVMIIFCLMAAPALVSRLYERVTVFPDRIERHRWFKTTTYPFDSIKGTFALSQRRFAPGFDILFHPQNQTKAESIGKLDVVEHDLCDLLNFYKDRAAS